MTPVSEARDPERLIAAGRGVISVEAEALRALHDALGSDFADAVNLILASAGRVIVSGMGKSGHVARKIAATFASTGTPALFVHPAEASHGDLGMITGGDVVLLLSNSGETPELADMIAYTRRFSIPLIGIAGRRDSTLIAPVGRGAGAAARARGLSDGARADHVHDDDARAGRRDGRGADGKPGFHAGGFPGIPSRRAARARGSPRWPT